MNWEIVLAVLLLLVGLGEAIGQRKRFKRKLSLAEKSAASRQSDDQMQFKIGVKGECLETFLDLEEKAKEYAKKMMFEMDGWHELAKDDGNWRTVIEADEKELAAIEKKKEVIEKSQAYEKIDPIDKEIKDIKNYQREMTKQMLKVVKLAQKEEHVSDFGSLDFIGRKELPCVKALQESYASRYPVLLNQVTSEVETATESELATAMAEMKAMILEYKKRTTKLRDDASKNEEIGPYMKEAQSMPNNDENF